jgi:glycosyltransferase involved in cell wall biosynthesis
MMTVSIVVPTRGRPDTLRSTLAALTRLDYSPAKHEIIVVDDGADPQTEGVVNDTRRDAPIQLVSQNGLGAATARNNGARRAQHEFLLFCDDDMLVEPDHLHLHAAVHAEFANALVGSDRWYAPNSLAALEATPFGRYRVQLERVFQSREWDRPIDEHRAEVEMLPANDLSISRALFWELGGFDESFPYAGAEDQDLCLKAREAGCRLIRDYRIKPQHDDPTVTLEKFATREERGAETIVVLSQNFPHMLRRFGENGPIARHDRLGLKIRKLVKSVLSCAPLLRALHALAHALERLPISERRLHLLYRTILGLHVFRGYRRALQERATPREDLPQSGAA